jgi:hypothetical protein
MKKRVMFWSLIFLLIFISVVNAQVEKKGANCLQKKVESKGCSSLTDEEQIFSFLALGICQNETNNGLQNHFNGDIQLTAQAILALNERKIGNTSDAEQWLLSQNKAFINNDITWYLQIESFPKSAATTTCTVEDSEEKKVELTIQEDKTLSFTPSNCLKSDDRGGYWIKIEGGCYNTEFKISCNEDFLTTSFFEKQDTIYISDKISPGSATGTTVEKINSLCFIESDACDYEGSLWSTLILNKHGHDVSSYTHYLKSMQDQNSEFLPEAFLYSLSTDRSLRNIIGNNLLLKQISPPQQPDQGYWEQGFSRHYDTALVLLSLRNIYPQARSKTETWLEAIQDSDGCWNHGNIRDTAFILQSFFGPGIAFTPQAVVCTTNDDCAAGQSCDSTTGTCVLECTTDDDCTTGEFCEEDICKECNETISCSAGYTCSSAGQCESVEEGAPSVIECANEGYYCMSAADCEGETLSDYVCSGFQICCSQEKTIETCASLGGEICDSDQECIEGSIESTPDLKFGQTCCVIGHCEAIGEEEDLTCEINGGTCIIDDECTEDEEESTETCDYGYICCMPKSAEPITSLWLWILLIFLIILAILGVVFRDKLRVLWMRLKNKLTKKQPPKIKPPVYRRTPPQRLPKRIPPTKRIPEKKSSELSDVLKKLKEMGK